LPQRVDIDIERLAEPRHPDNLAAGANRVDRLEQRARSREPLARASTGALENYVGAIATRHLADRRNHVSLARIQSPVAPTFFGHAAGPAAHFPRTQRARAAVARVLQTLEAHAPLPEARHRIADAYLRSLHRRNAVAQRLEAGGLVVGDV